MILARFFPHVRPIIVALAAYAGGAFAQAGTQPVVTSDLLRIRQVTSIDVARDGSRAVYAVKSIAEDVSAAGSKTTRPDEDDQHPSGDEELPRWKYRSHLFLLDLGDPDAKPRQITFGDRFDSAPRLSPDGRRIAFVRSASTVRSGRRDDHERAQVWIMPIDGGEAAGLTNFAEGCEDPIWSPDGRRILVSAEVRFADLDGVPTWPTERPRRAWNDVSADSVQASPDGSLEQIRAWLEQNAQADDPVVITRLDFQDERKLRGMATFRHLYVVDAADGAPTQPVAIEAARRITNGFFDHEAPAFMPDGQSIVYAAKKPTDQHPDRVLASDLWAVNVDGSNDRRILSLDGWTLTSPKPSRDGAVVAFTAARTDEPAFRQDQLGMASIKGETLSDPVWLTEEETFPASVSRFEWQGMQPALLFTAAMRGGFPLMTVSAGLLQPAALTAEEDGRPVGVGAFGSGGGATVYSVTSVANPCVLKVRDGRGERVAHNLNEWVSDKALSMPAMSEIARPDGLKVQVWLMEPTRRESGRRYPLCLQMHGGPAAMWGPGEFTMWHEFQLLCSRGFGVVYCNPRGSGGYGYAFQRGNFQDWGEGPCGDVLAACDHALNKDWVDPERLVITGGSYAGYLTAWVIAHDNRFKAAVAQRGVYDLDTFFGEGNAWRLVREAFAGNPYEARVREIITRNSPFTHVAKIRTPLLIMHSSNDLRTGVSQSEMLYRALKELNRAVEYVRYPNSGHDLSRTGDPRQRMDRLNRIIEFFERYVPRSSPTN
jgi:dipeptidyl aminopeptidase/acylaminoacyl peptidase